MNRSTAAERELRRATVTPADARPSPPGDLTRALVELGLRLCRQTDPTESYRDICIAARQLLQAEAAALWLVDSRTDELVGCLHLGEQGRETIPEDVSLRDRRHPLVTAVAEGGIQVVRGSVAQSAQGNATEAPELALLIPLTAPGHNAPTGILLASQAAKPLWPDPEVETIGRLLAQIVAPHLSTHQPGQATNESAPPAVLDAISDGVLLLGMNGVVEYVNEPAAVLLGVRAADLVNRHIREIQWPLVDTSGQPIPPDRLPFALALRERAPVLDRDLLASASSARTLVRVSVRFMDDGGIPTRAVVTLRDLTDHQELLKQLTRTETMRTVGQLASAAIHDINNWFGLILGQAELMLVADPPSEMTEGLESIRKAACDGAEALKRIQDLARSPSEAEPVPVDVNQILREVVDITRPRWSDSLTSSAAATSVIMDLAVPLAPISAVPSELREVFTNLILNAVDAMPHGGALRVASKRQRNRIVVTIADTGIGMTEDVRQRIFEPFFTTKGARGSGLGLAVSKTMIERHGGKISAESELGRGTTFILSFAPVERAKKLVEEQEVPPARPSRILLVEDDQHVREMMTRMLERDHHTVTACRSGREAITLLGGEVFDVVLTDLVMPGIDGWDVAQATRKAQANVPVILVTGVSQRFSESELRARGVTSRLSKPFRIEQLRRAVGNVLGTVEPEGSSSAQPRILAVDDEPAMTRMLTAMLQTSGCEIQTAHDGTDATLLLQEAASTGRPFGLLFTDMHMPGMDGGELIQRARMITPQLVTILLSGDGTDGAAVGADLSLPKPYSLASLLATLDQALALHTRVAPTR